LDPLTYCHGFCDALTRHHQAEDTSLFPALVERHPDLQATVDKLKHDHHLIAQLVVALTEPARHTPAQDPALHLAGLAAIMESHFQYEERALMGILAELRLEADVEDVLG
jgi:hemerythrin-like domain-containing protein